MPNASHAGGLWRYFRGPDRLRDEGSGSLKRQVPSGSLIAANRAARVGIQPDSA